MTNRAPVPAEVSRIGERTDSAALVAQSLLAKTNRLTGQQAVDHTFAMEQSIRKLRPDLGTSVNLFLTVALVAACSINALLLYVYL